MTPAPRPDVTALVDSLHGLVRHAHDDHTVATEAADMLVDLARRLTEQAAVIARLRELALSALNRVFTILRNLDLPDDVRVVLARDDAETSMQALFPGVEDEWARWLKDGETPLGRVKREHADNQLLLGLLAQERDKLAAAEQALAAARRELPETLSKLASWIRAAGNIDHNDPIDSCARLLENNARSFRERDEARAKLEGDDIGNS